MRSPISVVYGTPNCYLQFRRPSELEVSAGQKANAWPARLTFRLLALHITSTTLKPTHEVLLTGRRTSACRLPAGISGLSVHSGAASHHVSTIRL